MKKQDIKQYFDSIELTDEAYLELNARSKQPKKRYTKQLVLIVVSFCVLIGIVLTSQVQELKRSAAVVENNYNVALAPMFDFSDQFQEDAQQGMGVYLPNQDSKLDDLLREQELMNTAPKSLPVYQNLYPFRLKYFVNEISVQQMYEALDRMEKIFEVQDTLKTLEVYEEPMTICATYPNGLALMISGNNQVSVSMANGFKYVINNQSDGYQLMESYAYKITGEMYEVRQETMDEIPSTYLVKKNTNKVFENVESYPCTYYDQQYLIDDVAYPDYVVGFTLPLGPSYKNLGSFKLIDVQQAKAELLKQNYALATAFTNDLSIHMRALYNVEGYLVQEKDIRGVRLSYGFKNNAQTYWFPYYEFFIYIEGTTLSGEQEQSIVSVFVPAIESGYFVDMWQDILDTRKYH